MEPSIPLVTKFVAELHITNRYNNIAICYVRQGLDLEWNQRFAGAARLRRRAALGGLPRAPAVPRSTEAGKLKHSRSLHSAVAALRAATAPVGDDSGIPTGRLRCASGVEESRRAVADEVEGEDGEHDGGGGNRKTRWGESRRVTRESLSMEPSWRWGGRLLNREAHGALGQDCAAIPMALCTMMVE